MEKLKNKITIYSRQQVSLSLRGQIENLIENKAEKIKLSEAGIDPQTLKDANIRFELNTIILGAEGEEAMAMLKQVWVLDSFLVFLFTSSFSCMAPWLCTWSDRGKNQSHCEVIISSVSPSS